MGRIVIIFTLIGLTISLVAQRQHTVSMDPLLLKPGGLIMLQYEMSIDAKRSLFSRFYNHSDRTHTTGVQIGVHMSGPFEGSPILERGTHKDMRFDIGYRRFIGKKGYYGSGLMLEGFLGYQRIYAIEEGKPYLYKQKLFGAGYGIGWRKVFKFNLSAGIDLNGFLTMDRADDGSGGFNMVGTLGLHLGYVFNKQVKNLEKRRSRSRTKR